MKKKCLWVVFYFLLASALWAADANDGAGIFGKWVRDRNGLVAYSYQMDQRIDPKAVWSRGKSKSTLHWHQLGNLRINAIATNDGFVSLFYNDSAQRWLNNYDPANRAYAGGFGFVLDGNTAFATFYPFLSKDYTMKRTFGQGYFEKEMERNGLLINEINYAPSGDISALVMRVKLKNTSAVQKDVSYFAYYDVKPLVLIPFARAGMDKNASKGDKFTHELRADSSMIVAASKKIWGKDGGYPKGVTSRDPELPDVFFASLDKQGKALAVSRGQLFEKNGWKGASALKALTTNAALPAKDFGLVNVVKLSLAPGEEKVLNFAYGYAKAEKPEQVIAKIGDPEKAFAATIKYWQDSRPRLDLAQDKFLERELEWDNYYLTSSFLYDAYYERHFAPQGGHYVYVSGVNGAGRDLSAYILTLVYYHPDLAREMLELCLRNQETSGRLFYDFEGYGKRYSVPYRPSDLSLWVIWAATEYVFATRDFGFLQRELPYWPKENGKKGTVSEHLRKAYDYLEHDVGTGSHGLVKLKMSDWNDQMTLLVTKNDPIDFLLTYSGGESLLNTAMACSILPLFSDLLKNAGDSDKAKEVDQFHKQLAKALQKQWLASGWYPRAYSALGKSFGKKEIYLEPQVWALLSDGLMSKDQQDLLLKNINEKLRKPSKLGMMVSDATKGSTFSRPGEQERGGIWFAINGPGAVALSKFDPALGYDELKKNSLYQHATQYPEFWFGIWSGPDSYNSVFSKNPGGTWYSTDVTGGPSLWPVQNNHSHSQLMWALARIAGFNPTAEGFTISPAIPQESYKLDTGTLGIEKSPGRLAGYFKFGCSEWMLVTVKTPADLGKNLVLKIDGKESPFSEIDGGIKFPLNFAAGQKVQWEISKIVK